MRSVVYIHAGAVAEGVYVDSADTISNFGKLRVTTSAAHSDIDQMSAAGFLEGYLTAGGQALIEADNCNANSNALLLTACTARLLVHSLFAECSGFACSAHHYSQFQTAESRKCFVGRCLPA
jgi:hypothetical protein